MVSEEIAEKIFNNLKNSKTITAKQLAAMIDISEVSVRAIINYLRVKSYPIIANSKGYYISNDPEEIKLQINSLQCRINAMVSARNGLEALLHTIEQNQKISEQN